ncbi:MAG: patatin-like phospholipase family protein, partial [Pseudomonadota bacterium]
MAKEIAKLPPSKMPALEPQRVDAKIGLALGGGGARGLAHIAVLEALEELDLRPSVIAGTSIGAIYGAAAASGMSAAQIRAFTEATLVDRFGLVRQLFSARSEPRRMAFNFFPVRSAFLRPQSVVDLVLPSTVAATFDQTKVPLKIVATDINTTESVVIDSGDISTAVAASIAIPVVFSPVERQGRLLLDGGLTNPCPYDLLSEDCDVVIATADVDG